MRHLFSACSTPIIQRTNHSANWIFFQELSPPQLTAPIEIDPSRAIESPQTLLFSVKLCNNQLVFCIKVAGWGWEIDRGFWALQQLRCGKALGLGSKYWSKQRGKSVKWISIFSVVVSLTTLATVFLSFLLKSQPCLARTGVNTALPDVVRYKRID